MPVPEQLKAAALKIFERAHGPGWTVDWEEVITPQLQDTYTVGFDASCPVTKAAQRMPQDPSDPDPYGLPYAPRIGWFVLQLSRGTQIGVVWLDTDNGMVWDVETCMGEATAAGVAAGGQKGGLLWLLALVVGAYFYFKG